MHRIFVLLVFLAGCTTLPEEQWRIDERQEISDRKFGREYFEKIKAKIIFFGDEPTDSFLSEMGNILIKKATQISESPLSVYAIKDELSMTTFGLPGARIFIPTRLLREVEYESVLAAAISFEIAKIETRALAKKAEKEASYNFNLASLKQEPSIRELGEAAKNAVHILYSSGYDPRGLVSYWKLLQNNKKMSPLDEKSLKILVEISFEESASLPPLMKPVVKGERFLNIKKRWAQKL